MSRQRLRFPQMFTLANGLLHLLRENGGYMGSAANYRGCVPMCSTARISRFHTYPAIRQ